jgi:protein-disulfide isomerase
MTTRRIHDHIPDRRRFRTMMANWVAAISVGAAAIGVALLIGTGESGGDAGRRQDRPVPHVPIDVARTRTLGSRTASVGLAVFSDFQCAFCAAFAREVLPGLQQTYVDTGQLLVAFFHLPLTTLHRHALAAAEAAECAGEDRRFWEAHDLLFARQAEIGAIGAARLIRDAGISSGARFDTCLQGEVRPMIAEHAALAYDLGIRSTPTLLVGEVAHGESIKVVSRFSGGNPDGLEASIKRLIVQGATVGLVAVAR